MKTFILLLALALTSHAATLQLLNQSQVNGLTNALALKANTNAFNPNQFFVIGTNISIVSGALLTNAVATGGTFTGTTNTGGVLTNVTFIGVGTSNAAPAGTVGEYVESVVAAGAAVALTTATAADVTSISLTAGDWDVTGQVSYTADATTVIAFIQQGVSTNTGSLGWQDSYSTVALGATVTVDLGVPCMTQRLNLNGTTTVYLETKSAFTVSTLSAYGTIRARRVR